MSFDISHLPLPLKSEEGPVWLCCHAHPGFEGRCENEVSTTSR